RTLPDGNRDRSISFLARGLTVYANDKTNNISTLGKGAPKVLAPNFSCSVIYEGNFTEVDHEKILGFDTKHIRLDSLGETEDRWIAGPELDCVTLRSVENWKDAGHLTGAVTTLEATSAKAEAPSDSDFFVPSPGNEMLPSQYDRILHPDRATDLALQRMDAIY